MIRLVSRLRNGAGFEIVAEVDTQSLDTRMRILSLQCPGGVDMDVTDAVHHLRTLLTQLPLTLPHRDLDSSLVTPIVLCPEWLEEGTWAAVNQALESRLGPRTGPRDTFILQERGPGIETLPEFFDAHATELGGHALFMKWLDDSIRAAENVYISASVPVSSCGTCSCYHCRCLCHRSHPRIHILHPVHLRAHLSVNLR